MLSRAHIKKCMCHFITGGVNGFFLTTLPEKHGEDDTLCNLFKSNQGSSSRLFSFILKPYTDLHMSVLETRYFSTLSCLTGNLSVLPHSLIISSAPPGI